MITEEDFAKFREFFYRKTGIYFDTNKRYFVDKRLEDRISATKTQTFDNYFKLLRFETSLEVQNLVNCMTVNETYFLREEYQFKTLVNDILPEVVKNKKNEPIRIWCVPCSSGEEPYSICMYLMEYWKDLENYDVEIFASDIDTNILSTAKAGVYDSRSVQNVPAKMLKKYFVDGNKNYSIIDDIKESVTFSKANLSDPAIMKMFQKFDVIFCRNLLIYFDDISRRAAANIMYDLLNPGGFLCLGHSESMSRISSIFKIRKFNDSIVYQRSRGE